MSSSQSSLFIIHGSCLQGPVLYTVMAKDRKTFYNNNRLFKYADDDTAELPTT